MNKLINFYILLFVVLEYFSFFYTILHQTLVPSLKKQIKLIGLLFIILLIFSSFNFQRTTLYYIGLALSILLINILFESSVKDILKLYIVSFPTLSIFESVVIYIIQSISDMGEKGNALPCLIIIIIILWLYYLLIGKNLNKDAFQITEHVWLIVASVMIILCLLITYFTFLLTEIIVPKGKLIGIVLITSGSLTIFILNYILIYYFNTKQNFQSQVSFLEQYNEQQKQYFEDLLTKEKNTRQFRHDITAHLLQIQNMSQKGLCEEESQYIKELLDEISLINQKGYSVGNDIIDTILTNYLTPISSTCTIKVTGYMDQELNISRKDLCVIVSNLVKNAVEAINNNTCTTNKLIFKVNQGKQFLEIKVINSMNIKNVSIQNGHIITTKENKHLHGLGIQNIEETAKKYHGRYYYQIKDGYYSATVQLHIKPFVD